jgi:hypothetical protein
MDFFDILNEIMEQSDCDYTSITVTKNGKTLTSTIVKEKGKDDSDERRQVEE